MTRPDVSPLPEELRALLDVEAARRPPPGMRERVMERVLRDAGDLPPDDGGGGEGGEPGSDGSGGGEPPTGSGPPDAGPPDAGPPDAGAGELASNIAGATTAAKTSGLAAKTLLTLGKPWVAALAAGAIGAAAGAGVQSAVDEGARDTPPGLVASVGPESPSESAQNEAGEEPAPAEQTGETAQATPTEEPEVGADEATPGEASAEDVSHDEGASEAPSESAISPEAPAVRSRSQARRAPSAAEAEPSQTSLERERALLDRARTALGRGRPEDALEALGTHAALFPHGQLHEERDALRVHGLVAAGRPVEAETAAGRFVREHPGSPLRSSVEAAVDR